MNVPRSILQQSRYPMSIEDAALARGRALRGHTTEPDVRVTPEVDPWLTLHPGVRDGATEASVHLARTAQQQEREAAIADRLNDESMDLLRQQALDSLEREKLAPHVPGHSQTDKRDAAAVAIRLHEPRWQQVSRYYAADVVLVKLRKFMHDGHGHATDAELRQLADEIAGATHTARLMVWTGQIPVTAREWCKAALGFLRITEER